MLKGKRISLRAIEENDLSLIAKWRSEPDVYEYFYEYLPISLSQQKDWYLHQKNNKTEINFVVSLNTGEVIGTVSIVHIDYRNRKAEWGRLIIGAEEHKSAGYGREVEMLILQYCFEHLNLNKLYCEVLSTNMKVVNMHKKFGFKEEGVLKRHIFKYGKYIDVICMAMFSDEYFSGDITMLEKYKVELL